MLSRWFKQATVLLVYSTIISSYYVEDKEWREKMDQEHLPTALAPDYYTLKLFPRMEEGYYNGSVDINIVCKEATNSIVMHASKNMDIDTEKINVLNTAIYPFEKMTISRITRNETSETITIVLQEEMKEPNRYQVYIPFGGKLEQSIIIDYSTENQEIGGFLVGSYENPKKNNEKSFYAVTRTYPRYARKIFPCFDEPSFKAIFDVVVARPSDMTSVSATSIHHTEAAEDGYVWDYYESTPPIATFSVNVLVSDLKTTEPITVETDRGILAIRLHYREIRYMNSLREETALLPQFFKHLDDYFDLPYRLPVLDIVALPNIDYNTQADGLGLIMVQEYGVNDQDLAFLSYLPNQWTVHYCTPSTWTGFNISNMLSNYLIKDVFKKVSPPRQYIYGDEPYTLYDIYASRINFSNNEETSPYTTGRDEWLLKMLNASITEKTLKRALRNFLTNYIYGSFDEEMLWYEVNKQAHEDGTLPESIDVKDIKASWLKPNSFHYPVVTATRNYDDNTATLEQHIFMTELPLNLTEEENKLSWYVPIYYITQQNIDPEAKHQVTWMTERHAEMKNLPGPQMFIIVNPTDTGMFIVNYDKRNWKLLSKYLIESGDQLPTETRTKLLNDALLLAAGGELDYILALNMTLFLTNEKETKVWMPLINQLGSIETLYHYTSAEDKINQFIRQLLKTNFNPTQPDDNSDNNWYLVRDMYSKVGYQKSVDTARKELEKIMPVYTITDDTTDLELFCPEFMRNKAENWTERIEQLETSMMLIYESRQVIEKAISKCPGYKEVVTRILAEMLEENSVFTTERWLSMVTLVTNTPIAQKIAFSFFLKNYSDLKHRFYFMKDMWTALVSAVTSNIRTEEGLNQLTEFYDQYRGKLGYATETVESSIQEVTRAVEWGKKNLADIEYWVDNIWANYQKEKCTQ